jgi:hypothetical protein
MNVNGLLAIEYGFHSTLIIAGVTVAWFFTASCEARRLGSPIEVARQELNLR